MRPGAFRDGDFGSSREVSAPARTRQDDFLAPLFFAREFFVEAGTLEFSRLGEALGRGSAQAVEVDEDFEDAVSFFGEERLKCSPRFDGVIESDESDFGGAIGIERTGLTVLGFLDSRTKRTAELHVDEVLIPADALHAVIQADEFSLGKSDADEPLMDAAFEVAHTLERQLEFVIKPLVGHVRVSERSLGFTGTGSERATLQAFFHSDAGSESFFVVEGVLFRSSFDFASGLGEDTTERVEYRLASAIAHGSSGAAEFLGEREFDAAVGKFAPFAPAVAVVVDALDEAWFAFGFAFCGSRFAALRGHGAGAIGPEFWGQESLWKIVDGILSHLLYRMAMCMPAFLLHGNCRQSEHREVPDLRRVD